MKIVAFCVFAAIAYGILHDQITAHVAVEYFTIAHPPLLPTESPFWLGVGWGIVATWWVGLPLGILLAGVARLGRARKFSFADIRKPVVGLMLASGLAAMAVGCIGTALVASGVVSSIGGWEAEIAPEKHARFAFALWAHSASYFFGLVGGIFVVVRPWRKRQAATSSMNSG